MYVMAWSFLYIYIEYGKITSKYDHHILPYIRNRKYVRLRDYLIFRNMESIFTRRLMISLSQKNSNRKWYELMRAFLYDSVYYNMSSKINKEFVSVIITNSVKVNLGLFYL